MELNYFKYLNELNLIKELLGKTSKEYNNLYYTLSVDEIIDL